MWEAGSHQGSPQVRNLAHMNRAAVACRTRAARCHERFTGKRRMHDADAWLAINRQRRRNADVRMTVRVVRRSVDWIDDPNGSREVEGPFNRYLLAQKTMTRKPGGQMSSQDLIGTQVRGGDEFTTGPWSPDPNSPQ